MRNRTLSLAVTGMALLPVAAIGLEAEVRQVHGAPRLFVNQQAVSPLMFFGWATNSGPTVKTIGTDWQQVWLTFTAPENNVGHAGVHFRFGGDGPGTLWIDDVALYPGPKVDKPEQNMLRHGDWEGTRDEIAADWTLFQAAYASARAEWSLDTSTRVSGRQSGRIDILNGGENSMHLHFYQSGHTVEAGRQYTYSLWAKADRPRTIDFMALHHGEPWTIYGAGNSVYQDQVHLASQAGVRLYSFGIDMPWPRPGEAPNFAGTDRAIAATLAADPEGLLLPRFGMAPPEWWLEQHPDARLLFDDGKTEGWSMASEAWREDMQQHLAALVQHCEATYGDHMLGYHPCGQHTGEWFYYRSWEPRLSDFSPAMDRGFAAWLQTEYPTEADLRAAWNDPGITFATTHFPTAEQQLHTDIGFFRDPATEQQTIDAFRYKQVAMVEPLRMMSHVIKRETAGRKLVCLFYGYTFDMHGIPLGPQNSGHLAMGQLIRDPNVDIICSPISYLDRELGGAGCFMAAVDSVRAHGKLWLNEDDTRTWLTPKDSGYGRVDTIAGTLQVHRRNFAQIWPRRLACWYMDLGNAGWLNGKEIWDNIAPLQRYYQGHVAETDTWNPDVAVIVDEQAPFYTKCSRDLHAPLVYQMRSQFFRLGTPFAIYLLSDLVAGNVPPMRAYLFANCFRLDAAQRRAVNEVTQGRTAVWFYGGGFISAQASDAGMGETTGIHVARGESQTGTLNPTPEAGAWIDGVSAPFGTDATLDPLWVVTDPEAQALATFADGSVGAAIKRTDDGLRAYIGGLNCPAKLLRNILRLSDIHLYSDTDDVILADDHFLAVTATQPGRKELHLPGVRDVTTFPGGEPVAQGVTTLSVDLALGETLMFQLQEVEAKAAP